MLLISMSRTTRPLTGAPSTPSISCSAANINSAKRVRTMQSSGATKRPEIGSRSR